jgi:signal transduction histidine kinase
MFETVKFRHSRSRPSSLRIRLGILVGVLLFLALTMPGALELDWPGRAVFFLLLFLVAFRMIGTLVEPLSTLARTLDQVNVEDEAAPDLPKFRGNALEIAQVAASFQRLIERLHGYRVVNVKRLLIEKRRAEIIAASIADGIFLMRGTELLYVNPVGEKILGITSDKIQGGLDLASVVKDERRNGVAVVLEAMSRSIPVEFELLSSEDQRSQYYLLQSFPIPQEVVEQVEHSLQGPLDDLMGRWQATTLVLAQDVTIVRESQEAKSHFIATLSHEVKTPVTSLTMATRLLKRGVEQIPNPTHRSLVETCASDVDRLRGLIDDLLSVSRFDSLEQMLEIKPVDIGKFVRQSVRHFLPEAFDRGVEIITQIETDGKSPIVPIDATKISWALSNLLVNALRHAPKGGKVRALVVVGEEFVEIRIKDNGPGIARNRQERIFEKFNPYYNLRVARSGSVGMGLSIAREIVSAHGGEIWVTSEPGSGAEFCFSLPLRRDSKAPSPGLGLVPEKAPGTTLKGDSHGSSARSR